MTLKEARLNSMIATQESKFKQAAIIYGNSAQADPDSIQTARTRATAEALGESLILMLEVVQDLEPDEAREKVINIVESMRQ